MDKNLDYECPRDCKFISYKIPECIVTYCSTCGIVKEKICDSKEKEAE